MRTLLFIGATLMVGAGIYGFVDYRKKEQNRAFQALYKQEKPAVQQPAPEIVTSPVPIVPVAEVTVKTISHDKSAARKKARKEKFKKISYKQFSRAIPEEVLEEVKIEQTPPPVKKKD